MNEYGTALSENDNGWFDSSWLPCPRYGPACHLGLRPRSEELGIDFDAPSSLGNVPALNTSLSPTKTISVMPRWELPSIYSYSWRQ